MKPIFHIVTGAASRLLFVSGVLILCSVTSVPQKKDTSVTGEWVWKQIGSTNKSQIKFRIVIRHEGNILRGIYSVDEFVNGQWQGEDGNQTPFVGHRDGSGVRIEFDPLATQPGYEKDVSYTAPSDGRKPSIAIIRRSGSNLRWRLVRGPGIDGVPTDLVLRRERLSDRANSSERCDPTTCCSGARDSMVLKILLAA
jgi:hypothetical protein